jgi:hypothetical protein
MARPRRTDAQKPEMIVTARLPTSLVDALRRAARETDRSLSQQMRFVVRAWSEQQEHAVREGGV